MKNLFLILCSLCVVICSCKKSSDNNSSTALKGRIMLVDENNHISNDYSGVIITSENSATANISVDVNGEFYFPGLVDNSAYLTLNASKTGYGTVTQHYTKAQIDSFGSGAVLDLLLLPQSSVIINSLSGILDGDKFKMVCNVSLTQVKPTNGVTFFLSKNNSQVSFDNSAGNNAYQRTWTMPVTSGDNLNSFCYERTAECNCDFLSSGDTVFLKAYGDTYSPFGNSYFDLGTGKLIFPGINSNTSSSTISFIVP